MARCAETKRTEESVAEYARMSREEQSAVKDVGGFVGGYLSGGVRKTANVMYRTVATLDIDYGTPDVWDDFTLQFSFAAMLYSTHKHTPETPRYRLVFPLSRQVRPDEYEPLCRRVAEAVGIDRFDITTYQLPRLFYWPSTSRDGEYVFEVQDGEACDVDALLATYRNFRDASEWPLSSREGEAVAHELRKAGDPTEKGGLIGAFCRAYTIEEAIDKFLPEVYERTAMEGRYTYRKGSVAAGLVCYDGKFAYSHHETDPAGRQLCNAFDLVRIHLFGLHDEGSRVTDITRRPSYLSMQDFAAADKAVRVLLTQERREGAREDFEGIAAEEAGADEANTEWMETLDYDRKGNIRPTAVNALKVLENDPLLAGHLFYDEFRCSAVVVGGLPWNAKAKKWRDADNSQLRIYMEKVYNITGKDKIKDAKVSYIDSHSIHPVRDYLNSLRWDGVRRAERAVTDYLGAKDCGLNRAATRVWLTGAAARIFEPGCKFDYCLILAGRQGVGKSSFFEILAGEWYNGNLSSMSCDKASMEQLQGSWIFEIQELDSMKRREASQVKAFITNRNDKYRSAYKEETEDHPRQCVFGGTTNEAAFLKDDTGDRRFWVIQIEEGYRREGSPREALARDRDQIWAEVVQWYRQGGEPLMLEERHEREMEERRQSFSTNAEDPLPDMVYNFLETRLPPDWGCYTLDQRIRYFRDGEDIRTKGTELRRRASVTEFMLEYLGMRATSNEYQYKALKVKAIIDGLDEWAYVGRQRYNQGSLYQKIRQYERVETEEEEDI